MSELRPTPIILISFYCFLLGLFFFSQTANAVFGDNGIANSNDPLLWFPVAAYLIFAAVAVTVGIGILYYNQLCWKVLFFGLMILVSSVASLILVAVISICMAPDLFYKYCKDIHISPVTWFAFLSFFLSGIIVFYYLTRERIISYFGNMGPLIEPF